MARTRVIKKIENGVSVALIPQSDMDALMAEEAEWAQRVAEQAAVDAAAGPQQKTKSRSPKKKAEVQVDTHADTLL